MKFVPWTIRLLILPAVVWMCSCPSPLLADESTLSDESSRAVDASPEPRLLRHAVFFSFKPTSSEQDIQSVIDAFKQLPSKIDAIVDFRWGKAVSKAKITGGFTHAFLLTFQDEQGRSEYLPHPDHQAFGKLLRPHLQDVFVIDYLVTDQYGDASEVPAGQRLMHPVFFRFEQSATPQQIQAVEQGFIALPKAIDTVKHFEWGKNNSPESHDDGFTHCFMVTFSDAEGLKVYSPHPAHQAYVKTLGPVQKIRVIDFVTEP